ncbi:MAG: hypothetical protein ICV54_08090 [Nostoc sp. C3-bin3]|nr:hypothetical protein [Nostoc sp. C3-bin3]
MDRFSWIGDWGFTSATKFEKKKIDKCGVAFAQLKYRVLIFRVWIKTQPIKQWDVVPIRFG